MQQTISRFVSGGLEAPEVGNPVVILLHGYGSNEEDLPCLMSFLPFDLSWFSLRAPVALDNGYFAWSNRVVPGNPPTTDVEEATETVWRWVDENLPADSKLLVIGFSQGGLMATQLLRSKPERILGTVVLVGFTLDAEQPADLALLASKPKVIYCRGLQDQVISPEAVSRTLNWMKLHTTVEIHTYQNLGHSIDETVMVDVRHYLERILNL